MQPLNKNLSAWATLWFALAAILSFHLAYTMESCQILIVVFLYCLFHLANVQTSRRAFHIGLGIGLAIYAPQLSYFWTIFQAGAIPLWLILSFWLGLFLLLGWACLLRFGLVGWACAAPFVWTGLEYFSQRAWLSQVFLVERRLCVLRFEQPPLFGLLRSLWDRLRVNDHRSCFGRCSDTRLVRENLRRNRGDPPSIISSPGSSPAKLRSTELACNRRAT